MALRDACQLAKAPAPGWVVRDRLDDPVEPARTILLSGPSQSELAENLGGERCQDQLFPPSCRKLECQPIGGYSRRRRANAFDAAATRMVVRRKMDAEANCSVGPEPVVVRIAGAVNKEGSASPIAPSFLPQLGEAA